MKKTIIFVIALTFMGCIISKEKAIDIASTIPMIEQFKNGYPDPNWWIGFWEDSIDVKINFEFNSGYEIGMETRIRLKNKKMNNYDEPIIYIRKIVSRDTIKPVEHGGVHYKYGNKINISYQIWHWIVASEFKPSALEIIDRTGGGK